MSESEKRLRALLGTMVQGMMPAVAEWKQGEAVRLLDAILVEHRAEVEASEAERKKLADRMERAVGNVDTIATAARNSALDEAWDLANGVACAAMRRRDNADTSTPAGKAAFRTAEGQWDVLGPLADDIRALKAQPARQYVDAEKVREVLARLYEEGKRARYGVADSRSARYAEHTGRMGAAFAAARDLGVDLGASIPAPQPSTRAHWLNDCQECSDRCPACSENMARGFNPDGSNVNAEGEA